MMILGKIKVDSHLYEYYDINYDPFYVTIKNDDEKELTEIFNSAKSIIIMDQFGLVVRSITNYSGVESTTKFYNYYMDDEGEFQAVVKVSLKSIDLTEKVKQIEAELNQSEADETSMSVDEYRDHKIRQFGEVCQEKIYAGVDVETSYGKEHFSATGDDQANIKTLSDVAMATKVSLPYHADGSQCKVYSYQDIVKIYCEIQKLILAETSYCNALNTFVRGLYTKEDIAKVKYGQEITDSSIKANMDSVIAQGEAVMEAIAAKYLTEETVPDQSTDSAEDTTETESKKE